MNKILTCIIEECPLMREGIKSLLDESHFDVQMEIESFDENTKKTLHTHNLTILSASNSSNAIIQTILILRKTAPNMKIVILSDNYDGSFISTCSSSGADGLLLKSISAKALIASLELVMIGEKVFPTSMASIMSSGVNYWQDNEGIECDLNDDFSPRAIKIISCLAGGCSNKLIARNLDITESTVKVHMKTILRKLELANRTQVALWAVSHGIKPETQNPPLSIRLN